MTLKEKRYIVRQFMAGEDSEKLCLDANRGGRVGCLCVAYQQAIRDYMNGKFKLESTSKRARRLKP